MPRELCSNFGRIFCWDKIFKKSLDAISAQYCGSYAQNAGAMLTFWWGTLFG